MTKKSFNDETKFDVGMFFKEIRHTRGGSVAKSETQKTLSLTNRQSKQVFPLIF